MERLSNELINVMDRNIPRKEQSQYLADLLGKTTQYVRARMNGKMSWTFDEARIISEEFEIPDDKILWFFGWRRGEPFEKKKRAWRIVTDEGSIYLDIPDGMKLQEI